ncbi:MAG: hypothetical protein Q9227_004859 [Pyrenula ochraceoflavens]
MVYFGPSRGCETCKRRRKKCDEARPSCKRCLDAKRTCGGYEDGTNLILRQYEGKDGKTVPFKSMARKCSLPIRLTSPGNGNVPEDSLPKEITDEKTEEYALRAFFYDYCVVSANPSLSRGFLNGLEAMLHRQGQQSDLAKACKVVAFANNGRKLFRPMMMQKAEMMYHNLLGSLARAIENASPTNSVEFLMIAMLLAGETHPGYHNAHAKGVAAILQTESSSLDFLGAVQYIRFVRSNHPLVVNGAIQNYGVFSTPCSKHLNQSLDDLLLKFGALWERSDGLLANPLMESRDLSILKDEALQLEREIAIWQVNQVDDFKPWTVGYVSPEQSGPNPGVGFWPGKVDAYFDLSVASIWNTSRIARILLINLVLKISKEVDDGHDHSCERQEAIWLVQDIIASIPYHLTEDLQIFFRDVQKNNGITDPGKPLGGLLLMHSIYVASRLSIVPPQMQEYMRKCLAWIALYLGIGQASLFANVSVGPGPVDTRTFHV